MTTTSFSSADWWKIGFILVGFIILSIISAYNRTLMLMNPRFPIYMGGNSASDHAASDLFEPPRMNANRTF